MPGLALDLNLDLDLQVACRRLSYRGAYSPSSPKSPPLPTIHESPEEEPTPPPTSPRTTGALYPAPGETPTPTVGAPVATSLCLALPGQSQSLQAQDVGAAATRMLEQQRKPRNRVSFAEYQRPAPGEMPTPTVVAPVATWLALAPPALSQSQQAQEAAAATRMLEQRHEEESSAFPEYQRPTPGETLAATVGVPVATWLAFASPAQLQSQQAQEVAAATRMLEQRRHEEERASFAEYQQQRQHALAAEAGLQQALAAQQESQQLMLYTLDGRAASYETKWDDLHPVSQGLLLQIEDIIREHRDDSEQLDQYRCFDDLSLCNMSFELDANQITQTSQISVLSVVLNVVSIFICNWMFDDHLNYISAFTT